MRRVAQALEAGGEQVESYSAPGTQTLLMRLFSPACALLLWMPPRPMRRCKSPHLSGDRVSHGMCASGRSPALAAGLHAQIGRAVIDSDKSAVVRKAGPPTGEYLHPKFKLPKGHASDSQCVGGFCASRRVFGRNAFQPTRPMN